MVQEIAIKRSHAGTRPAVTGRLGQERIKGFDDQFPSRHHGRSVFLGKTNGFHGSCTNPFSQVAKLKEGVKDMATLSASQLSEYLTVAKSVMTTSNYAAVMLISYTGMRARETTALRWSDIDFERKRIMVMRTAIETTGGYSFAQTKGKKVHVITIPDIVVEELTRIQRELKYDQVRLGWRNTENLVCTSVTGAYLWHSELRRRHHLTLASTELPAVTLQVCAIRTLPYSLRSGRMRSHPRTTWSCGCQSDDGHVCPCNSHFAGKHRDTIRCSFGRQKNRSTERFVNIRQKDKKSGNWRLPYP